MKAGRSFDIQKTHKMEDWRGKAIWLDPERFPDVQESIFTTFDNHVPNRYAVARFERKIMIEPGCREVVIWATGDTKYRLYMDGTFLGMGPAESGGDYGNDKPLKYRFYDRFDLQPEGGEHEIVAEVALQPEVMAEYSMGHGAFLSDIEIVYENGCRQIIGTDETWMAGVDSRYAESCRFRGSGGFEYFPAAEIDVEWELLPKEIPNRVYESICPAELNNPFYPDRVKWENGSFTVTAGSPVSFWLRFDKTYAGYLCFCTKEHTNAVFRLHTQEMPGRCDRTEIILPDGQPVCYQGLMLQSVHYLQVEISRLEKPVTFSLEVLAASYPNGGEGTFACSDDLLNKIYELGKWTLHICRQSYHLDSPIHQEALGCTGDYMIESLINYYTFGDPYLTRLDIIRTARWLEHNDYRMFHTSYSLMWIQMLWDYYWFTADSQLIEEYMGTVTKLLDRFESYVGESGLLDQAPNYMFMDWVPVGEFNLHHPPMVMGLGYLSALYYQGLQLALKMQKVIGVQEEIVFDAALYQRRADRIKESFQKLWSSDNEMYMDGIHVGEAITRDWMPYGEGEYYSQHTNTMAVLYDLVPKEMQKSLMRKVMTQQHLTQAQPYFYHFIFEALYKTGLFEAYGLDALRKWSDLLKECDAGLKEVWGGFDCDYSHAWGATPTYQMPSKILGVIPVEPGFKKVKVEPALGGLKWAKGCVPTSFGKIEVVCDTSGVQVKLPEGVQLQQ